MLFLSLYLTVPSPVEGLTVSRERQRKLNISWEQPEEPNDYTINYTVTIIDIITGSEWNETVVNMNQLSVLSPVLGMIYSNNGLYTPLAKHYPLSLKYHLITGLSTHVSLTVIFISSERFSLQCDHFCN